MVDKDIFMFGKPGSGKGTLAKMIANNDTGVVHMSTGDIFRQNMKAGTDLGQEITAVMNSGELVNDELTNAVVEQFIMGNFNKLMIFDGFPRNDFQLHWLLRWYLDEERPLPYFVNLAVDDAICVERIATRAKEQNRPEDANESVIKRRLDIYRQDTEIVQSLMPNYLPPENIIELDATGTPKDVYKQFMYTINPHR